MKVIGKESVSYFSKKRNEQVDGVKLHCTTANDRVDGQSVETIWVSRKSDIYKEISGLKLNSDISCSYNRWGSIESIKIV